MNTYPSALQGAVGLVLLILRDRAETTFFDFAKDIFPRFLEAGESSVGYQGNYYWSDIGALEEYRQAQYDALSGAVDVEVPGERRGEGV